MPCSRAFNFDSPGLSIREVPLRNFFDRRNIVAGILSGCTLALLLSVIAIGVYASRGFTALANQLGVTLGQVIAAYFAGGVVGGALAGALTPLAHSGWGAAVVGFVAVFPFAAIVTRLLLAGQPWFPPGATIATIGALILGAGPAAVAQRALHRGEGSAGQPS